MTVESHDSSGGEVRHLYLDVLRGSLAHSLYKELDVGTFEARNRGVRAAVRLLRRVGVIPVRIVADAEGMRAEGKDIPMFAQTMIGLKRLDNIRDCIEQIICDEVPGDLIEAGVWRGGASIFMRGVLKAHGVHDRRVWLADSFAGLPPPRPDQYPRDAGSIYHLSARLAVSQEEVRDNFARYGLLDDQVKFVEGWFSDTLPSLSDERWSLIRLDGDMYESTMDGLENLYPNLAVGGFLIVDDYALSPCRQAIHDFRARNGIKAEIREVDWTGAYWRRDG
ncbi:MAG: TylF/MycF/NovP-related O-methyltransferase [Solirubrobacteraceae bacterium]